MSLFQTPTDQPIRARNACPDAPKPENRNLGWFERELAFQALLAPFDGAFQEPSDVQEALETLLARRQEEFQALLALLDRNQAAEAREALEAIIALDAQIQVLYDLLYLLEEIAG